MTALCERDDTTDDLDNSRGCGETQGYEKRIERLRVLNSGNLGRRYGEWLGKLRRLWETKGGRHLLAVFEDY